jgi:phosphohistidine phosphatase
MLELLLFRHAKSRRDQPGLKDRERDLAPRGEAAAPRMGRHLREQGRVPDRVLCSSAVRAVRTWRLAAPELGPGAPEVEIEPALYMAEPDILLDTIRRHGGDARRLMLVGHNPGLHELALLLVGEGKAGPRARLKEKFPTAAVALVVFDLPAWDRTGPRTGRLEAFWRPRDLD